MVAVADWGEAQEGRTRRLGVRRSCRSHWAPERSAQGAGNEFSGSGGVLARETSQNRRPKERSGTPNVIQLPDTRPVRPGVRWRWL